MSQEEWDESEDKLEEFEEQPIESIHRDEQVWSELNKGISYTNISLESLI